MISDRTLVRLTRSPAFVALAGDLIRALCVVALVGVVALCLTYYAYLGHRMYAELNMNDFGRFYYSARAFLEHTDMYGPTPATPVTVGGASAQLWNMNPPHFHLVMLPLALLDPLKAVMLWLAINLLALAASFRVAGRELGWQWTPVSLLWTATAVVLSSATGIIVITGQLSFLIMWPMTLAWAAARHARWSRAAIWLGIAAAVKPFLGIFGIYLLLTGRLRAGATMALTVVACLALGIAVFGWTAYAGWLHVISKVDWAFAPMNASLAGLLARSLADSPVFVPLIHAPALVSPVSTVLAVLVGAFSLWIFARDRSTAGVDRAFAGLVLTALLVSPLGWMYYLWLAAGPLLALWQRGDARASTFRDAFIVVSVPGLLLPLYMTTVRADLPVVSVTLGSTYTWTVLALWAAVVIDQAATRRNAADGGRHTLVG